MAQDLITPNKLFVDYLATLCFGHGWYSRIRRIIYDLCYPTDFRVILCSGFIWLQVTGTLLRPAQGGKIKVK